MLSFSVFFIIVPMVLLKFFMNFNHLLVSLLYLEFISLSFFLGLNMNLSMFFFENVYMLYFLVLIVSEGVLGLCLLILMSFFYGNDFFFCYNKLLC